MMVYFKSVYTYVCIWISTNDSIRQYQYNIIAAVRAHELLMGFARHFGNSKLAISREPGHDLSSSGRRISMYAVTIFLLKFFNYRIIIIIIIITIVLARRPLKFAENGR